MIVHNHTERLTNYAERNPENDIANKWLLEFALEPLGDNHHWHLQNKDKTHGIQSFGFTCHPETAAELRRHITRLCISMYSWAHVSRSNTSGNSPTTSVGEQDCISHHNDQLGLLMRQKAAFDQHAGHSMLHTGICVRQCRILKHHRKWQCTALHATLKSDMQRPDSM